MGTSFECVEGWLGRPEKDLKSLQPSMEDKKRTRRGQEETLRAMLVFGLDRRSVVLSLFWGLALPWGSGDAISGVT